MEWHDPTISCNRALQGIGGCEDERVQHADHVGMRIVAGGGRVDELYPAQAQQRTRQLPWGRASQAGAAAGGSPHRISQLGSAFEACSRPTQQCNRALSSASRNKPALRRAAELAEIGGKGAFFQLYVIEPFFEISKSQMKSQSVSHYHTPSRELMAHTLTLLTRVRVRRVCACSPQVRWSK